MSENRLHLETSPYLQQHRDNPVHWQAWGEEALARAKAENKPILLSVGYAACHWCHVMAHESFENDDIAAQMNALFVNIKVDREERPDIDSIYQSALHMMGEQGGWPLTMFLTPDGDPFWGGTYFPPSPRFGRPGFPQVLDSVATVFEKEPDRINQNVTALRDGLAKLSQPTPGGGTVEIALLDQVADKLTENVDVFRGGLGGAPKFPQSQILEQIWRAWKRRGKEPHRKAVLVSLDNMCQGGIYDHLGGGFARYSVDERWLVPHFEKMLYDNAQLVDLLTLVWQETQNPLYADRIEETIGWVLREMTTEKGGFSSSLDADSEGEEGKFYVWSEAEIDALLGGAAPAFKSAYDVTAAGNWEGKTILNRLHRMERLDETTEAGLAESRAILWAERAKRIPPGLDDKVLVDWNGLMIAAMATAGWIFNRPEWIEAATRAFHFIVKDMTVDGRLRHSWRAGQSRHAAILDDYANMCRAALALHEATGEPGYISQAETWIEITETHYADAKRGGYFLTADDTPGLITRTKHANDNAIPAGNGVFVGVFARLYHLTGDDRYRAKAEALTAAFSGELQRNFFPFSSLLNGQELLQSGQQVVIIGAPDDPGTAALHGVLRRMSLPNRVLTTLAPGAHLPKGHPAAGKTALDGKATAYLCRGMTCSAPVTDPAALQDALSGDPAPGGAAG
jgi:uncharacterized protein YyaL (SSP411 family)